MEILQNVFDEQYTMECNPGFSLLFCGMHSGKYIIADKQQTKGQQTDRQTDRLVDKRADRHTDRQADRHRKTESGLSNNT